jgi:hypothetical protein
MADSIRGLTVEISADAKKFNSGMREVRNETKLSQQELNALQKSLEVDYNPQTLIKAQQAAQEAVEATHKSAEVLSDRLKYLESIGSVDTAEYKKLQTELIKTETEAKKLEKTFEELKSKKFEELAKQFNNVGDAVSNAGKKLLPLSVAATATLGTFAALGSKAVSSASEISKLADQYGMTATALQRFDYIAMQTSTSADDMRKAMVTLRSGVADLATGAVSSTSKALQHLGVDLTQFENSDEQFYAVIATLGNMTNETERVTLANEIFGDQMANKLLPIIHAGGDAISEYASEFEEVGAMGDEQVESLAAFENVLNKLKAQFANVALQIGASFLPIMEKIAEMISTHIIPKLQQLAAWFNNLSVAQQEFAVKALLIVAALAPVAMIIGKIISGVGGLIAIIPQLASGLSVLAAHPIIAIIGVIAVLIMVLYTANEKFRESINNLIGTLTGALAPILDLIMGLIGALVTALTPILNMLGDMLAVVIDIVIAALQPFLDILTVIVGIISGILNSALGVVINQFGTMFSVLTPVINMVKTLFSALMPLINIALLPLNLALKMLQVPLTVLGEMLNWLAPIFTLFANIITKAFGVVIKVVNMVLKGIETAINAGISIINGLVDAYNATLGWLFGNAGKISKVSLQVKLPATNDTNAGSIDTSGNPANNQPDTQYPWDNVNTDGSAGDQYNYNYDNSNTTQNVTVVIENYAREVDVDNLVRQINIKLAEAL